jgi:DNA-binding CsgD family transcriptional regulator
MKKSSFNEFSVIWKPITRTKKSGEELTIDLEVHKKLFNLFQVGDFYYMILNVPEANLEFVSEQIEKMLGVSAKDLSLANFFDRIHPEDQPIVLSFENFIGTFFANLPIEKIPCYKIRYDFRIRKANGDYLRILQQVVVIDYDDDGFFYKTLGVHTDISDLKTEGKPLLSLIGIDGEPSYINIDVEQKYTATSFLSKREKQIINLMIAGKVSKEIANELYLSQHTIDTYRKKLLKKTATSTTAELIGKVIREGWV